MRGGRKLRGRGGKGVEEVWGMEERKENPS